MKESVYLETTVVSYYTSKPSRDIIVLANQEITRQWWPYASKRYDIYISEIVFEEACLGDPDASELRLHRIEPFIYLELNDEVKKMTKVYMEELNLPEKSFRDAAHLAIASVHKVDYLVTWNCAHLANGEVIKRLMKVNGSYNIHTPIICTPQELMEV